MKINRVILTAMFVVIVSEILLVFGGIGNTPYGGQLFVEGSINRIDLNQGWKCADVIQNPDAVREELAVRKIKGDHKIRKFIENCIKWGDGWRFKRDGQRSLSSSSSPFLSSVNQPETNQQSSELSSLSNPLYDYYYSPSLSSNTALSTTSPGNSDLMLRYLLWKNRFIINDDNPWLPGPEISTRQQFLPSSSFGGGNSLETNDSQTKTKL